MINIRFPGLYRNDSSEVGLSSLDSRMRRETIPEVAAKHAEELKRQGQHPSGRGMSTAGISLLQGEQ
ncbi:hypothetical protein BK138_25885 [Paenibacillus rhizosphaerae]|uniref:Uncharacterized protein n=1 Tax=Paenibacillus rhizosphaerae TaxID=297318 RepID=A0A1R1EIQ1_9BACL|nr:hypothetical protein BK138_25885 [Paenibacillus rhizosphaerae]OXL85354.1 hypothetical protein BCV73_21350 [Paenibacillus sp. SSG-1]